MAGRPFERTLIVKPTTEQALSSGNRQGTLTVLSGTGMGELLVLGRPRMVIGRGETADLRIEDGSVSRSHACVWQVGQKFEIEDLGSSNGTFLEQGRVNARTALADGSKIGIGSSVLRFAMQDEIDQAASKRLYHLSVYDGLTGLYNRRHFDERFAAELAFSLRHGSHLSLILIDIDHFKQVNDRYGHQAGDAVLQYLGGVLQKSVRTEDVVARYGGEEFAVVARGIDATGAKAFAERIRSLVLQSSATYEGSRIAVTVSLGVAHRHLGGVSSQSSGLMAAADQALYAAKHAGRNRVAMARPAGTYSETVTGPKSQQGRRSRSWEQPTAPSNIKVPRE